MLHAIFRALPRFLQRCNSWSTLHCTHRLGFHPLFEVPGPAVSCFFLLPALLLQCPNRAVDITVSLCFLVSFSNFSFLHVCSAPPIWLTLHHDALRLFSRTPHCRHWPRVPSGLLPLIEHWLLRNKRGPQSVRKPELSGNICWVMPKTCHSSPF